MKNSLNFVSTCLKVVDTRRWTNTLESAILVVVRGQFHRHLFAIDSVAEMPCTNRPIKVPSLHAQSDQMCNSTFGVFP